MFSLICAWINGWVNNREAGDLRRHRAHYDVIVMSDTQVTQQPCYYIMSDFFYVFCLINWPLGDTTVIWLIIFKLNPRTDIFSIPCVIALRWTPKTSMMICQYWFRWLLGAVRHQAITWSNIDQVLWHHMSSPNDNESNKLDGGFRSVCFIHTCMVANFNTLRPRHNRRNFADDIFKCIFLNENVWIPTKVPLKFVPKCPIDSFQNLFR